MTLGRLGPLQVEILQGEPSFARLRVTRARETVMVDLIAEPVAPVESPASIDVGGVFILVATPHDSLVDKLCALLGRSELRDLEDVRVLIESGGDLKRALDDAPRKDGAFSPLTLAWVLRNLDISRLAQASDWDGEAAARLETYRDRLVDEITALAAPRE
jgi:hypothetical protein